MKDINTKIIDNIVEKVKRSDMTMQEFEDKIGMSRGYFSRCKTYKTKGMNVVTLIKCAEVLGCEIGDFL